MDIITDRLIKPTKLMIDTLILCKAWYQIDGNSCGGEFHIVLDEDNITDEDIQWCRDRCKDEFGLVILNKLSEIPEEHRIWVTYNIHNDNIVEVYEEEDD